MAERKKLILAVDDAQTILQIIQNILAGKYVVHTATSGALAMLALDRVTPDLILLDIEMPGKSGFQVMDELRANAKLREIPVIFVTAHATPEIVATAARKGAKDYIVKPLKPELLREKVDKVLLTNNAVLSAISERRSIRGYAPEQITNMQLDMLLLAAQQAPSANNLQPYSFSVVQDPYILSEIGAEASKGLDGSVDDVFYGAPTVVFLSVDPQNRWARLDSGIAVQTIALAAHSVGLGSVILGLDAAFSGPRAQDFNSLLKFPDTYSFAVAIAIGVPAMTKEAHPIAPDRVVYV